MEIKRKISYKKHILSFLITSMIFIIIFSIPPILETKRLSYLEKSKEDLQEEINLLSESRVRFCEKIEKSLLGNEINKMKNNLRIIKENINKENIEKVAELKKNLFLIQIEYLSLIEKSNSKCEFDLIPIIYIYSTKNETTNHQTQKFVFNYLNEKYSNLRFFFFDYDLELKEIKDLKQKISHKENKEVLNRDLSIIKTKDKIYYGFKDVEEMEKILEEFTLELRGE